MNTVLAPSEGSITGSRLDPSSSSSAFAKGEKLVRMIQQIKVETKTNRIVPNRHKMLLVVRITATCLIDIAASIETTWLVSHVKRFIWKACRSRW